jgi:hypothetical protein
MPLLFIATMFGGSGLIPTAGLITLLLEGGITVTVFIARKDFSFMRGILSVGGFVALGFIICSMIFGFSLGLIFASVIVLFGQVHSSTPPPISYTITHLINMWLLLWLNFPLSLCCSFTSFRC